MEGGGGGQWWRVRYIASVAKHLIQPMLATRADRLRAAHELIVEDVEKCSYLGLQKHHGIITGRTYPSTYPPPPPPQLGKMWLFTHMLGVQCYPIFFSSWGPESHYSKNSEFRQPPMYNCIVWTFTEMNFECKSHFIWKYNMFWPNSSYCV